MVAPRFEASRLMEEAKSLDKEPPEQRLSKFQQIATKGVALKNSTDQSDVLTTLTEQIHVLPDTDAKMAGCAAIYDTISQLRSSNAKAEVIAALQKQLPKIEGMDTNTVSNALLATAARIENDYAKVKTVTTQAESLSQISDIPTKVRMFNNTCGFNSTIDDDYAKLEGFSALTKAFTEMPHGEHKVNPFLYLCALSDTFKNDEAKMEAFIPFVEAFSGSSLGDRRLGGFSNLCMIGRSFQQDQHKKQAAIALSNKLPELPESSFIDNENVNEKASGFFEVNNMIASIQNTADKEEAIDALRKQVDGFALEVVRNEINKLLPSQDENMP